MNSKSFNLKDVVLYDEETGKEVYRAGNIIMETTSISFPKFHYIDFSKVETVDDIKVILESLNIGFYDDNPRYEKVKRFMKD